MHALQKSCIALHHDIEYNSVVSSLGISILHRIEIEQFSPITNGYRQYNAIILSTWMSDCEIEIYI